MAAQEQTTTSTGVESGNIRVQCIVNGHSCDVARQTGDGGGVITISDSAVPFNIKLTMKNSSRKAFTIGEMSVGDQVTGIQNIYYSTSTVTGYKTGETGDFVFYSLSDKEKEEGVAGPAKDTSIIKIKVTEYERIPYVEPVRYRSYDSSGGYDRGGGGGYDRGGGSTFRGLSADCSRGCGSAYRSLSALPKGGGPTLESASAASSYSGGGTIKGDKYVSRVNTTTTKDTFTNPQHHVLTIQLACSASDETKFRSNRRYKQKLLQKEQLSLTRAEDELAEENRALRRLIESQQQRVDRARAKCDTIRTEVDESSAKFTSVYGDDPTHESHAGIFMNLE